MITDAIKTLVEGHDLSAEETHIAMMQVMSGDASPTQISAFVVALRMKGETPDEIAGCARAMRAHVTPARPSRADLVDTCGTGGDGLNTFNISTSAALVAAAAGATVAKHGNRAMSSRTGSADVLEALGVRIDLAPARTWPSASTRSASGSCSPRPTTRPCATSAPCGASSASARCSTCSGR